MSEAHKLDRSRPFGTVTPPWQDDDFDRPAFFEQDGRFFDQFGIEIIRGVPLSKMKLEKQETKDDHTQKAEKPPMNPVQLLRQADTMPWSRFKKEAKRILGDACPASKAEIKIALEQAIAAYRQRQQVRMARVGQSEEPGTPVVAQSPRNTSVPAPTGPAKGSTSVDLEAWARGKKDYLIGDLRKAFKLKYNKVITERRDALDFLIEQRVVTPQEARKDIE